MADCTGGQIYIHRAVLSNVWPL